MTTESIEVRPGVVRHFDLEGGDGLSASTPFRTRFFAQEGATGINITTNTQVLTLSGLHLCTRLSIQIFNTGSSAFTAFRVESKGHPSGGWIPRLNAAAHYVTPPSQSILRSCASTATGNAVDMVTLAAGAGAELVFDLTTFLCTDLRFFASSSGTTAMYFYTGA